MLLRMMLLFISAFAMLMQLGCGGADSAPKSPAPDDIPGLLKALKSGDEAVVRDAAQSLAEHGANTGEVISALIHANTFDTGESLVTVTCNGQFVPYAKSVD